MKIYTMTNKDFAIAANKVFYYLYNYKCDTITYPSITGKDKTASMPEFFKAFPPSLIEHLWGKWMNYRAEMSAEAATLEFYMNIDASLRYRLLEFINEHYDQKPTFGISIPLEDDVERQLSITSRLNNRLRLRYFLTSEAKEEDEEPLYLELAGYYKLYYDEGNEEAKVISGDKELFWSEVPYIDKLEILKAYEKEF